MANDMEQNDREQETSEDTDAMVALREFQKQNPRVFQGELEPTVAEQWLRHVEQILNAMGIADDRTRVSLATFQLEKEADQWWHSIHTSQDVRTITWQQFRDLFMDRYFPPIFRHMIEQEFLKLEQQEMTVTEYEAEFEELARYAHELVPDEESRIRRFLRGLKTTVKGRMSVLDLHSYSEAFGRALIAEQEAYDGKALRELVFGDRSAKRQRTSSASDQKTCYRCEQRGHTRKDCPQRDAQDDFNKSSVSHQSQSNTFPPDGRICFHCRQRGHYIKECPQMKARHDFSGSFESQQLHPDTFSPDQDICFNCKQPGHYREECPQREARHDFGESSQSQQLNHDTFAPDPNTCSHCEQPGHYWKDCPLIEARHDFSRSYQSQLSHPDTFAPDQIICFRCKQPGHHKKDCPQKEARHNYGRSFESQRLHPDTFPPDPEICWDCKLPGYYRKECPQREAKHDFSGCYQSQHSYIDTSAPEQNICFHCKQPGHYRKDCPYREASHDFGGSYQSQQSGPTWQETPSASEPEGSSGSESERSQRRRRFRQPRKQSRRQVISGQGQRTCHRCGQPGHYRQECPRSGVKQKLSKPSRLASAV